MRGCRPRASGDPVFQSFAMAHELPPASCDLPPSVAPGLLDARFRGHDSGEARRERNRALSPARQTDMGGKIVGMNVLSLRRHDPDQVQRVPAVRGGGSLSSLPELPSERR